MTVLQANEKLFSALLSTGCVIIFLVIDNNMLGILYDLLNEQCSFISIDVYFGLLRLFIVKNG